MKKIEIEKIEIDALLEAVLKRYGYDFRQYAKASLKRRLRLFLDKVGGKRVSELIPRLLYDEQLFGMLVQNVSVTVTNMFRDPRVFLALREQVFPFLQTYPFIRIWHAGCATGEEVYSLVILLKEAKLYERATIYATDFSDAALHKAKTGIYPLKSVRQYSADYRKSGGRSSFSDYYHAEYGHVRLDPALREKIVFANHNLVTDRAFGEMHLILCRNVLIYFDKPLQDRVLALFDESLIHHGFLCIGTKESLRFSGIHERYEEVDAKAKIYTKQADL